MSGYWCHTCNKEVDAVDFKCVECQGEFVEELEQGASREELSSYQVQSDDSTRRNEGPRASTQPPPALRELFRLIGGNTNDESFSFTISPNGPGAVSPLMQMLRLLNVPGTGSFGGNMGDYVPENQLADVISRLFNTSQSNGPPPASEESLSKLKKKKVDQKVADSKIDCAICKSLFELDEDMTELPCDHSFHHNCIETWLKLHNSCPICRFELPTDDPDYEQERIRRSGGIPVNSSETTLTSIDNNPPSSNDDNSQNILDSSSSTSSSQSSSLSPSSTVITPSTSASTTTSLLPDNTPVSASTSQNNVSNAEVDTGPGSSITNPMDIESSDDL